MGIAALAVMILTGTAMAQGHGGGAHSASGAHAEEHEMDTSPGGHGQYNGFGPEYLARFRMMFRHMNLSGEQIEEIDSIIEAARIKTREIMEEGCRPEEFTPFMDVFTSPALTVNDLEEVTGHDAEVREDVQDVIFQAMVDIHDVLTVEQLERMSVIAGEHAAEMTDDSVMEHSLGR